MGQHVSPLTLLWACSQGERTKESAHERWLIMIKARGSLPGMKRSIYRCHDEDQKEVEEEEGMVPRPEAAAACPVTRRRMLAHLRKIMGRSQPKRTPRMRVACHIGGYSGAKTTYMTSSKNAADQKFRRMSTARK
eukprot:evm.model.NODE_39470_length_18909_cov_33.933311.3